MPPADSDYDRIRRSISNRTMYFRGSWLSFRLMVLGGIIALPIVLLLKSPAVYIVALLLIVAPLIWRYRVSQRAGWDALVERSKSGDPMAYQEYLAEARTARRVLQIGHIWLAGTFVYVAVKYAIDGRWVVAILAGVGAAVFAGFVARQLFSRPHRERHRAFFEGRMTSEACLGGDPDAAASSVQASGAGPS